MATCTQSLFVCGLCTHTHTEEWDADLSLNRKRGGHFLLDTDRLLPDSEHLGRLQLGHCKRVKRKLGSHTDHTAMNNPNRVYFSSNAVLLTNWPEVKKERQENDKRTNAEGIKVSQTVACTSPKRSQKAQQLLKGACRKRGLILAPATKSWPTAQRPRPA